MLDGKAIKSTEAIKTIEKMMNIVTVDRLVLKYNILLMPFFCYCHHLFLKL